MKIPAAVVEARREALAKRIASEGYLPLSEHCRRMGISVATARRDLTYLHRHGRISRVRGGALARGRPAAAANHAAATPTSPKVTGTAAGDLYSSPAAHTLKSALCAIGRRAWRRGLLAGGSGHLSARLGEHALCTAAGTSCGFLEQEMLCLVDRDGTQVAAHAHWRRSPEVLVDAAIYRAVPEAAAVVHAHPVHATAFAISGQEPPGQLLPEFEMLVGPLGIAEYRMPGSPELAALVAELAPRHRSILLRNHGLVCWGISIEDAYLRLEATEAYCQTVAVAQGMSDRLAPIPPDEFALLAEWRSRHRIPND